MKKAPRPKESPPATVEPKPIGAQDFTGTLSVKAREASQGFGSLYKAPGWFFINGDLQGKLPFFKDVRLTPGEYEVRCVLLYQLVDSRESPKLNAGPQFVTITGKVRVERGTVCPCSLAPDSGSPGTAPQYPEGFVVRRSPDVRTAFPHVKYGTLAEAERDLATEAEELPAKWDRFLGSPEWKAIERWRGASLARRRVRIDLPEHLGGPRDIDAEQMRGLRWWFTEYAAWSLRSGRPVLGFGKEANQQPDRYQHIVAGNRKLGQFRRQREEWVGKEIDKLIEALERAPGEK